MSKKTENRKNNKTSHTILIIFLLTNHLCQSFLATSPFTNCRTYQNWGEVMTVFN